MMKKLAFYLCCLLAVFLLVMCALIFVPFPSRYEKGPLVHYRVEEGAIEIFSLVNGEVGSLLGVVRSGETFTPRNIAAPEKEVPFAMSWLQSSMTAAVRRANKFMLKQSKKSRYRDFCVCYTDDSIKRGFTKELEKTRVISNVRMNFYTDGFSISGRVGPVPVFIRGTPAPGERAITFSCASGGSKSGNSFYRRTSCGYWKMFF
jgi:hypothetical protein